MEVSMHRTLCQVTKAVFAGPTAGGQCPFGKRHRPLPKGSFVENQPKTVRRNPLRGAGSGGGAEYEAGAGGYYRRGSRRREGERTGEGHDIGSVSKRRSKF